VQAAVLDPRLPGVTEAGERLAALVGTALEDHVHHALQLVLPAVHAPARPRRVAGGLLGAPGVLAVLVPHVHHALLDVVLAEQPSGLACMDSWGCEDLGVKPRIYFVEERVLSGLMCLDGAV